LDLTDENNEYGNHDLEELGGKEKLTSKEVKKPYL